MDEELGVAGAAPSLLIAARDVMDASVPVRRGTGRPLVINHPPQWPLMNGVVCSVLAAMSVLAAVGIRYPWQLLAVMLFEILWKGIWLIAVALPLWLANQIDPRTWETVTDCLTVVILIPLIPWRYASSQYVTKPDDRWRTWRRLMVDGGATRKASA